MSTKRKRNDPWPPEWAIINKKDGRIMAGVLDSRLHIYANRKDAREAMRDHSMMSREGTVVRVRLTEVRP